MTIECHKSGRLAIWMLCSCFAGGSLSHFTRMIAEEFVQQVHVPYSKASGLGSDNVSSVIVIGDSTYATTEQGIFSHTHNEWKKVYTPSSKLSILASSNEGVSDDRLWFVDGEWIVRLTVGNSAERLAKIPTAMTIQCLCIVDGRVYVGSDQGLSTIENGELKSVVSVNRLLGTTSAIRQIAYRGGQLIVAAMGGLATFDVASNEASLLVPSDGTAGWSLRDVRAVGFDTSNTLWFAAPQGCGRRSEGKWKLWGVQDGIPWNDFTCLEAFGKTSGVWFGTTKGAIRFDGHRWEYRQGRRWLLDDHITSIAVSENGDCWLATSQGLSRIEERKMTFQQKSAAINDAIDQHHKRTEYGYVDAVTLKHSNDDSEWTQHDSDNDGLWTSMYGAAQCFEYAATKSATSRKRANAAFQAVAFLSEVTQGGKHAPPRGFPARSILPVTGRDPNLQDNPTKDKQHQSSDPLWKVLDPRWPISADGKWYWKTDTSSDELDGHYFFYALYHDLVAETESEKKSVREVVDRVTSHLIDNKFCLVDHDGHPTRWGQFSPEAINTDRLTDCRGLNSLSILSYLLVASHITGDDKYQRAYRTLMHEHHYFTNIISPKYQNGPGSGNQSDDEMAFMCYYNAFSYEHDPAIRKQFMRSMTRYFPQELPEACPLFNLVFARSWIPRSDQDRSLQAKILADAKDTLMRFPMDRRQWSFENSHRLDVLPLGDHIVPSKGRGHLRNGYVIPIDERNINHWNQDPWRLNQSGNGLELADGAAFLLPYWMGVYHNLIP